MLRQANSYEKAIFDIVKEYNNRFYYHKIQKVIDTDDFKLEIKKDKEEMVGRAVVILNNGEKQIYEVKYNRITNLNEGYTLMVPAAIAD